MTFPIQLNTDTRKSWASDPRDLSTLLINVLTIINEVVTDKASKAYLEALKKGISYFSDENFQVSATIGAFYRSSNPNIVTITNDDMDCIKSQLLRMDIKEAPESYLKRFTALGRSPKDSHISLLKEFLFPHISLKTKDKYTVVIKEIINATLAMVDFVNTPFAVLYAEEELNENPNLQTKWKAIIKELIRALTQLDQVKITPSEIIKTKISEITSDMNRFQSTFELQKKLYETQQENQKLKTDRHAKYLELSQYIHTTMNAESKEFDMDDDFIQPLIDYGNNWHAQYTALESAHSEEKEVFEAAQLKDTLKIHSLNTLVEQLRSEASQIKHENESLKANCASRLKEIDALKKTVQKQLDELTSIKQNTLSKQDNHPTQKQDLASDRDNDHTQQDPTHRQDNYPQHVTEQSEPPIVPPFPPIVVTELIEKFEAKFKNTNSSGIKEIISFMKVLETEQITEFDKLALLSDKMRRITLERKDSSWSKSHFFGKGRHQGVQDLYDLMANKNFSLNVPDKADEFLAMIGDTNKVFIHSFTH